MPRCIPITIEVFFRSSGDAQKSHQLNLENQETLQQERNFGGLELHTLREYPHISANPSSIQEGLPGYSGLHIHGHASIKLTGHVVM